jgi:hypothetical protein
VDQRVPVECDLWERETLRGNSTDASKAGHLRMLLLPE